MNFMRAWLFLFILLVSCGDKASSTTPMMHSAAQWWSEYGDPELNKLVAALQEHNLEARIAKKRIEEARAVLGSSFLRRLPQLSLNGNRSDDKSAAKFRDRTIPRSARRFRTATATLNLQYDLDIWGRTTQEMKKGQLGVQIQEEESRALYEKLVADLIKAWITRQSLKKQLNLTQELMDHHTTHEHQLKKLLEAGQITQRHYRRELRRHQQLKHSYYSMERQLKNQEESIAFLTGRDKAPPAIQKFDWNKFKMDPPLFDASLIQNRPDVRIAAWNLENTLVDEKLAKISFLPQLTFSGNYGYQSEKIRQLVSPSHIFWNMIGGLSQPLLNRGLNARELERAQKAVKRQGLEFKLVARRTLKEIADLYDLMEEMSKKHALDKKLLQDAHHEVKESRTLLKKGLITQTQFLEYQRETLTLQIDCIQSQRDLILAGIDLRRALGTP